MINAEFKYYSCQVAKMYTCKARTRFLKTLVQYNYVKEHFACSKTTLNMLI